MRTRGRTPAPPGDRESGRNAVTHTNDRVFVTVARHDEKTALVSVRDQGPGIDAEHLPHVFDRFYRVDPSRSRAHGGTGLGLAIAAALVEAHHGRIEVESVAGEGATFRVTLPFMSGSA
ncbi:sensor histidine kinase [Herbidospora solisilvae]|uniref:sensor histidine kinase n=1 Tax=Herbidospora solisilvae TaxID=2696284 RepID=UPI001929D984|nr:sensor histidine kinase [Herbidospora solisilvae]